MQVGRHRRLACVQFAVKVRQFAACVFQEAIPTPKITPDKVRLAAPSPKANISPPTRIATNAMPVAMGPAEAVCNTCTACVPGESRGLGKDLIGVSAVQAADVSKPFLRKR